MSIRCNIVEGYLLKGEPDVTPFTATSSPWLNLVERWFGEVTGKRIRRDVLCKVPTLMIAIEEYIRLNNENPSLVSRPKTLIRSWRRCLIVKPLLLHYTSSCI